MASVMTAEAVKLSDPDPDVVAYLDDLFDRQLNDVSLRGRVYVRSMFQEIDIEEGGLSHDFDYSVQPVFVPVLQDTDVDRLLGASTSVFSSAFNALRVWLVQVPTLIDTYDIDAVISELSIPDDHPLMTPDRQRRRQVGDRNPAGQPGQLPGRTVPIESH
jgi:hypothetical protein